MFWRKEGVRQGVGPIKTATGYDGQLGMDWVESMQRVGGQEGTS